MTAPGRPGLPKVLGVIMASLLSEDNRRVNANRIEVSGERPFHLQKNRVFR